MLSYVPWTSVRTRPRSRKRCHACLLQIALCGFFVPSWILQTMPTCHAVMMKYICPRETIQSDCPDDWSWSSIVPLHAIKSQQNHIYQDCYGTYTLYIVNNLRTTVGQRFRAELVLHRLRSFFFIPAQMLATRKCSFHCQKYRNWGHQPLLQIQNALQASHHNPFARVDDPSWLWRLRMRKSQRRIP